MVVLMTGCSGYVGSAIAEALLEDGAKLLALWNRRPPAIPAVRFWRLDLGDPEAAAELRRLPRFDACVNAAGVPKFFGVPEEHMRAVHVSGTLALAEECARRSVPFVHVSTAFVSSPPGVAIPECAPGAGATGANPYEATKTEAEWMLDRCGGAGIDILRPAIVTPGLEADANTVRCSPVGAFLHSALRDLRRWQEAVPPQASLVCTDRRWLAQLVANLIRRPTGSGTRWWNLGAEAPPTVQAIAEALGIGPGSAPGACPPTRAGYWRRYLDPTLAWETTRTKRRLERRGFENPIVTAEEIAGCIAALRIAREERIA